MLIVAVVLILALLVPIIWRGEAQRQQEIERVKAEAVEKAKEKAKVEAAAKATQDSPVKAEAKAKEEERQREGAKDVEK